MTPAARIAAAIEILEAIAAAEQPADHVAKAYLRSRRYIGSKDRRAVADRVFAVLRRRARLGWWCLGVGLDPEAPRHLALAALVLCEELSLKGLEDLFDGSRYHPSALVEAERAALTDLQGQPLDAPDQEPWVRLECPAWLWTDFQSTFGEALEAELGALREEAPLDLRVNALKAEREEVRRQLEREGIACETTAFSPLGLRAEGRRAVTATQPFRDGLVEIQDEGAQLLALLTDARPGQAVCDLCAGGGGKTLALGAAMAGEGRLVAADIEARRLAAARPRLRRAGLAAVEERVLETLDPWLAAQAGSFDRVLVDAPCSGSGTWRRNPEARWRLTRGQLQGLQAQQDGLLTQAADLVRPGGRLVYGTCSLLPAENAARSEAFLESRSDFRPLPAAGVWKEVIDAPYPGGDEALTLTPARHGTDGFYVAIFERERRSEA